MHPMHLVFVSQLRPGERIISDFGPLEIAELAFGIMSGDAGDVGIVEAVFSNGSILRYFSTDLIFRLGDPPNGWN